MCFLCLLGVYNYLSPYSFYDASVSSLSSSAVCSCVPSSVFVVLCLSVYVVSCSIMCV